MAIVKRKPARVARTRRPDPVARKATRRAASTAGRTIVRVVRSERVRRVARRTGQAIKSSASMTAMAQARGIPALAGGYAIAMAEAYFRKRVASKIGKGEKLNFLDDPTYRLAAQAFAIAFLSTSRSAGSLRQIVGKSAEGALGAIAAFYQLYTAKAGNPVDDYAGAIKAGNAGV